MDLLIVFILSINLIIILFLRTAFRKQVNKIGVPTAEKPFISVIVAARNEEETLPHLLQAMRLQDYQNFELIVMDDRSSDNTSRICEQIETLDKRFRSYRINTTAKRLPPKKNALSEGIARAKGSIFLFTDADCLPNPNWIKSMSSRFLPGVGVVIGPSIYDPPVRTHFRRFVEYEKLRNIFLASASVALGIPWLAGGANIGYRKEVFDEIGGFSDIARTASGDDDLLIQRVKSQTQWEIDYSLESHAIVTTTPPSGLKDYFHQKVRHFSVTPLFSLELKMLSALYAISNLMLYTSPFFFWAFASNLLPFLVLLVKIIADYWMALSFVRHFQRRDVWLYTPFIEPLLVFHGMFFAIAHYFIKAEWKKN